ncbi:MAG TPA: S1C family serine protease [Symbiobacteriaceae bacterium]|nr:S1C family serine protease [Symbiobacteriaceae bacterium]
MQKVQTCAKCGTVYYGRPRRCLACGHPIRRPGPGAEVVTIAVLAALVGVLVWVAVAPEPPGTVAQPQPAPAPAPPQTPVSPAPAAGGRPLDLKSVIELVKPAVVRIDVQLSANTGAIGSGFVCDAQGHVLTNQHVIAGARQVRVTAADGRQHAATVAFTDPAADLALLKVPELAGTAPLAISTTGHLGQGDHVVAIGSPEGLTNSVSDGIISALHRNLTVEGRPLQDLIQTTAPISHGSSGGPLVEVGTGKVIGVTTAGDEEGANLGFAVSGDTIVRVMKKWTGQ